jgi:hypothetical protein
MFTIDVGVQIVTVVDVNGNVVFDLSINVTAMVQMTVTVSSTNPSPTNLPGGINYFSIDVASGSYNSIVAKFYYNATQLQPGQEGQLDVAWLGPSGWEEQYGQVNTASHCVLVDLPHFCTYAVYVVPTTSSSNNQFPTEYVLIGVFAAVAVIGIGLAVKMRKTKVSGASSSGNIDLDWDW